MFPALAAKPGSVRGNRRLVEVVFNAGMIAMYIEGE
jgi:hypothetical protein